MPLSEIEYKALILRRVGVELPEPTDLDLIWKRHDDKKPRELRYNYALLEAIELLLGDNWQLFSASEDGQRGELSQKFEHLVKLAERAEKEIERLQKARRAASMSVSRLTTKAPVDTPASMPDANSIDYSGSAYSLRRGW
jgi:hypothetical protein